MGFVGDLVFWFVVLVLLVARVVIIVVPLLFIGLAIMRAGLTPQHRSPV